LYIANLINDADHALKLQYLQMPGGYAGDGKFFGCSLEHSGRGRTRSKILFQDTAPPVSQRQDVELRVGEKMEVCRLMLPTQGGKMGECVRFVLSPRWKRDTNSVSSKPFMIGSDPSKSGRCE